MEDSFAKKDAITGEYKFDAQKFFNSNVWSELKQNIAGIEDEVIPTFTTNVVNSIAEKMNLLFNPSTLGSAMEQLADYKKVTGNEKATVKDIFGKAINGEYFLTYDAFTAYREAMIATLVN